ncbi:hypothetical protein E2C01_005396 [Portunus trituberculatus]|uniref:Uncharacterized protein n=1 Tax=Portunus trituberculatus TaxID=210409 RepID=A0A5B7CSN9_PORTR|nr:hypothetical protein [Portunus trituberculatus]
MRVLVKLKCGGGELTGDLVVVKKDVGVASRSIICTSICRRASIICASICRFTSSTARCFSASRFARISTSMTSALCRTSATSCWCRQLVRSSSSCSAATRASGVPVITRPPRMSSSVARITSANFCECLCSCADKGPASGGRCRGGGPPGIRAGTIMPGPPTPPTILIPDVVMMGPRPPAMLMEPGGGGPNTPLDPTLLEGGA